VTRRYDKKEKEKKTQRNVSSDKKSESKANSEKSQISGQLTFVRRQKLNKKREICLFVIEDKQKQTKRSF
jgi:hypothetical protein